MNRWPNLICHPCLPSLRAVKRLANLGGRVTAEQQSVAGSTQEVQRSPSRHSGWDTAAQGWQLPVPTEVTHTQSHHFYIWSIYQYALHTHSRIHKTNHIRLWRLALSQKTVPFVPENIIYFYHFITAKLLRNHILPPQAQGCNRHRPTIAGLPTIDIKINSQQIFFMQHIHS